jgi:hypothetical protein
MTIETICNQALDLIGYKRHIGNIHEGSLAARVALDIWGQTRDHLLEVEEPDWAITDLLLGLNKSAPNIVNYTANYDNGWNSNYPEIPWLYEYVYPTDCIKPLQIKSQVLFSPIWKPQPYTFRESSTRGILTNAPNAILVYIKRVLDPDDWDIMFTSKLIVALAKQFEPGLAPRPQRAPAKEQSNADASS